jgi:hypothetical protein
MIGTLTSLILALFFLFSPQGHNVTASWTPLAIAIGGVAGLFIFLSPLIQTLSWLPLQKAEKSMSPRLLELTRHDGRLKFNQVWLIFFSLVSFALALCGNLLEVPTRTLSFAIWLFFFGISLDILQSTIKRVMSYLNPYAALDHFSKAGKKSIQNDREMDLCDVVDALSETAIKGMHHSGTVLSIEALSRIQDIFKHFLEAAKSIAHPEHTKESEKLGITDKISYTLFYILQRLEMVNHLAAIKTLEPVCSSVVTTLGKIAIHAAKLDISLSPFPIQTLGKSALLAEKHGLADVSVKATITLLEVARTILQEIDVTYLELRDTYQTIVSQMNEIAKEAFKQDKTLSIPLLKQPFVQLRELFVGEKIASHTDTPAILASIDRAIAEFDVLEMVLKSIPPIPNLTMPEQVPPVATGPVSLGG